MVNRTIGRYKSRQFQQAWHYLAEGSVSAVTQVNWIFTQGMLDNYRALKLHLTNGVSTPDISNHYARTSADFGSSWNSGATDYAGGADYASVTPGGSGFSRVGNPEIYTSWFRQDMRAFAEFIFFTPRNSARNMVYYRGGVFNYSYKGIICPNVTTPITAFQLTSFDSGVTWSTDWLITGMK